MSTSILLAAFALLLTTGAGGVLLRKRSRRNSTAKTTPLTETEASGGDAKSEDTRTPRDARIERMSAAYENGEIDERMIGTAARVLGISADEARRRLENAGGAEGTASIGAHNRARTRTKNRKKNKQAKRSRQANRR